MITLGWIVIAACVVLYVGGHARRQWAAAQGVRRQLRDLLGLEDAEDWPRPSVVTPAGDVLGHGGVLTGTTATGRRYWLDLDSPYYRTTDFNFVAISLDVGDDVDDLRIAPGGAWTKVRPGDESFRRRFNVSGVDELAPSLRDAITSTSPSAIEILDGRLTVVTTRGREPRLRDAVRAFGVLDELVEALDASYHGFAASVGDIDVEPLREAEEEAEAAPSNRILNVLFAGTVVGALLVMTG
ncbi:MAG: hypothetical protein AAF480_03865 [Actinomycetota bacterium]